MIVLRDISTLKIRTKKQTFLDGVLESQIVTERSIKSVSLIFLKPTPKEAAEKSVQYNSVGSVIHRKIINSQIIQPRSLLRSDNTVSNVRFLREQGLKIYRPNTNEINISHLIHRISYETKRSNRLSEHFRQLLFRHFVGYERDIFHQGSGETGNLFCKQMLRNDHYSEGIFQRNSTRETRMVYRYLRLINQQQLLGTLRVFSELVQRSPVEKVTENLKAIHLLRVQQRYYSHQSIQPEKILTVDSSFISLMLRRQEVIIRRDRIMTNRMNTTAKELHSSHRLIRHLTYETSPAFILRSLLAAKEKKSKYHQQFKTLFPREEVLRPHNTITYNQIIHQGLRLKKDLKVIRTMVAYYTERQKKNLGKEVINLNRNETARVSQSDDLIPFQADHRKNQHEIVTNLLGMITSEMSKSISVRNKMNHLVVSTGTVTEMKQGEKVHKQLLNKLTKTVFFAGEKQGLYTNGEAVNLEYKYNKKTAESVSSEVEILDRVKLLTEAQFLKKTELSVEADMLTEGAVHYLSNRIMGNIDARNRRNLARKGR